MLPALWSFFWGLCDVLMDTELIISELFSILAAAVDIVGQICVHRIITKQNLVLRRTSTTLHIVVGLQCRPAGGMRIFALLLVQPSHAIEEQRACKFGSAV